MAETYTGPMDDTMFTRSKIARCRMVVQVGSAGIAMLYCAKPLQKNPKTGKYGTIVCPDHA